MKMDSGLGSDEDRRTRTKEQKQRLNQQLLSGCFIDAASLTDEGEETNRRTDERRQGNLIFQSSIPQFSMLQMGSEEHQTYPSMTVSCSAVPALESEPNTPYNSIVQIDDEKVDAIPKTPLGFYVDLNDVQEDPSPPPSTSSKKNIFSMVIDFEAPKKDMPSRLSSSLTAHRKPKSEKKTNKPMDKQRAELTASSRSGSSSSCNGNCSSNSMDTKAARKLSVNGRNYNSLRKSSSSSDSSVHNPEINSNVPHVDNGDTSGRASLVQHSEDKEETEVNLDKSETKLNGCTSVDVKEEEEEKKVVVQVEDSTTNNTQVTI